MNEKTDPETTPEVSEPSGKRKVAATTASTVVTVALGMIATALIERASKKVTELIIPPKN